MQRTLTRVSERHVKEFRDYWLAMMWTCGICLQPFTKKDGPCVDHDHYTGEIRGVLHISCNGIEGRLESMNHRGYRARLSMARRCHAGVKGETFLFHLKRYKEYYAVSRTGMIHPKHRMPNERAGVPKHKRNWRVKK